MCFANNNPIKLVQVIEVLSELHELRHLDISDDKDDDPPFGSGKLKIGDFLKKSGSWPHLVSLDISGKNQDILVIFSFTSTLSKC